MSAPACADPVCTGRHSRNKNTPVSYTHLLKYVTDQKITFANAFGIADDVLKQAVNSISELVGYSDRVIINLDFADVSTLSLIHI